MTYLWLISISAILAAVFIDAECHSERLKYQTKPKHAKHLHSRKLGESYDTYPFQNISLDWKARVDDLVSRLTVDEVILQLTRGGASSNGPAPPIPRLGIGPFQWDSECLRGYVDDGPATSFPDSINLAATFDKSIVFRVAEAGASEARAKHADYAKHGQFGDHTGLSCFSPVINIMAHPLWGRSQETYGEDPSLTAQIGESFVRGLMGNDSRYIRANSVCKHFAAYNGPEDKPSSRFSFNAVVPEVDMRMTFLPQFEACVKAGALGVMCSYNSVNGVPACANDWLMNKVLRDEWNFPGFVVSDEGAVESCRTDHHYFDTTMQTAVGCIKSGVNLELTGDSSPIFLLLSDAVKQGLVDKALLYERVWPLFYTRMRLGEFDPEEMNPYTKYNLSLIQSAPQKNLSLLAAKKSIIMLKHKGDVLPVKAKSLPTLTLIGPFATTTDQFFGAYSPTPDIHNTVIVLDGMRMLVPHPENVSVEPGCGDPACRNYGDKQRSLVRAAVQRERSLVVLALGTGQMNEAEGNDRASFELPGGQSAMLSDVLAVAESTHVPVVVLLFTTSPANITKAIESDAVSAVFQCGFPAQETGLALYHLLALVDDDSNPAGRLPYTWYRDVSQLPSMTDYDMRNKTYRFMQPATVPLFSFGFGLSYSEFQYSFVDRTLQIAAPGVASASARVSIRNVGRYNGDAVVQLYARWPQAVYQDPEFERVPNLQLIAFERVPLKAGETQVISMQIDTNWLRLWSVNQYVVPSGSYSFFVGGSLPDKDTQQLPDAEQGLAIMTVNVGVSPNEITFLDIEEALAGVLFRDSL